MQTAEIALLVSILAVMISTATFGWTVHRDTIRPKVRVRWSISMVLEQGMKREDIPEYAMLNLTNMGPSSVQIHMAQLGYSRWWQRRWRLLRGKYAYGAVPHSLPGFSQLPATLEVGDSVNVVFPVDSDAITGDEFDRIGVFDSFGRNHWCKQKEFLDTRRAGREKLKES